MANAPNTNPPFYGYLDKFDAVCKRCSVTYDVLRGKAEDLIHGCKACNAPLGTGFIYEVEVKAWVASDEHHIEIDTEIRQGIATLFGIAPGIQIPTTINKVINIEARPTRRVFQSRPNQGPVAVVDFPVDCSDAIMDEYTQKFGTSPDLFSQHSTNTALNLFESVHQVKRSIFDISNIDSVTPNPAVDWKTE